MKWSNFTQILSVIICFLYLNAKGAEQQMELYTEIDQQGDGLLLRSKIANLKELSPKIIGNIKSFCVQGRWRLFEKPDFAAKDATELLSFATKTLKCLNSGLGNMTGSARYIGPQDTDTASISFFTEKTLLGSEIVVEASSFDHIVFHVKSLATTGNSQWTVYTEKNFTGTSTCYNSSAKVTILDEVTVQIKSVEKGCDKKTDNYVNLENAKSGLSVTTK